MSVGEKDLHRGSITSLGGVVGLQDRGLEITVCETHNGDVPFVSSMQVLSSNPSRKWALLQNAGSTTLLLSFGVGGGTGFRVAPNGHLLINDDLRWTGEVLAASLVALGTLGVIEASVQGE